MFSFFCIAREVKGGGGGGGGVSVGEEERDVVDASGSDTCGARGGGAAGAGDSEGPPE